MVKEVQAEYERLHSLLVPENMPEIPPNTILYADKAGAFSYLENVTDTISLIKEIEEEKKGGNKSRIIEKMKKDMLKK